MDSKASKLTNFIEWLNNSSIPYLIPWGYEKLPEELSGGDVDLCVHPEHYLAVAKELLRRGYSYANCPAYSLTHMHAHFAQTGYHSIDLFSSFCFAFEGKTTVLNIDVKAFLFGKIKHGDFWISSPLVELLFTALRIVGGRKDCIERLRKFLEAN